MNTQPERPSPNRHHPSDQPWLLPPITAHAAMTALGFEPFRSVHDAPFIMALGLQPRHALIDGALRGAEASFLGCNAGFTPGDPQDAARLGNWLLESACHEAQDWNAVQDLPRTLTGGALRTSPELRLSVELHASILRTDILVKQTRQALARSGLLPCLLELQLPASALTDGDTDMLLSLAALRDLGVGLGIDRFGTLAASPRMLQRLPLTAVKLDPALTRDIIKDRAVRVTVKAAIALAHALDTTVLATGVENAIQRDILADLGCDDAQGPMFGGTLRPEAFHNSLLVPRQT